MVSAAMPFSQPHTAPHLRATAHHNPYAPLPAMGWCHGGGMDGGFAGSVANSMSLYIAYRIHHYALATSACYYARSCHWSLFVPLLLVSMRFPNSLWFNSGL